MITPISYFRFIFVSIPRTIVCHCPSLEYTLIIVPKIRIRQRFFAIYLTFWTFLADVPVIPRHMYKSPYTIKFHGHFLCVFSLEENPARGIKKEHVSNMLFGSIMQTRHCFLCCFYAYAYAAGAVCFHCGYIPAAPCRSPHLL